MEINPAIWAVVARTWVLQCSTLEIGFPLEKRCVESELLSTAVAIS